MLPRRHLLFKFFASFLAMAALTVGLLWLIQAGLMRDSYLNQLIADAQLAVSEAAQTHTLDVTSLSEKTGATILVLDASGDLVNTSTRMPMMGMALRHVQTMFQLVIFLRVKSSVAATAPCAMPWSASRCRKGAPSLPCYP